MIIVVLTQVRQLPEELCQEKGTKVLKRAHRHNVPAALLASGRSFELRHGLLSHQLPIVIFLPSVARSRSWRPVCCLQKPISQSARQSVVAHGPLNESLTGQ